MDRKNKYRLRIQNCIWTIIDVHNAISDEYENRDFLSRFESLKDNFQSLDLSHISETDVLVVEQATNVLLGEFQSIFESGDLSLVYGVQEN